MIFLEEVVPCKKEEEMSTDQVPDKEGPPLPIVVSRIECPVGLNFGNLNCDESHSDEGDE